MSRLSRVRPERAFDRGRRGSCWSDCFWQPAPKLLKAVRRDDLQAVEAVIERTKPEDLDFVVNRAVGIWKETPLHWACANGNAAIVKLLVEKGGDVHAFNMEGSTPLGIAPQALDPSACEEIFFTLLRAGANVAQCCTDETLLSNAVRCENIVMVKLVLENGGLPQIAAKFSSGVGHRKVTLAPLEYAQSKGLTSLIDILQEAQWRYEKENVEKKAKMGLTPNSS